MAWGPFLRSRSSFVSLGFASVSCALFFSLWLNFRYPLRFVLSKKVAVFQVLHNYWVGQSSNKQCDIDFLKQIFLVYTSTGHTYFALGNTRRAICQRDLMKLCAAWSDDLVTVQSMLKQMDQTPMRRSKKLRPPNI